MSFMEKLLDGSVVEWLPLEQIAKIKHGKDWKGLNPGASQFMGPAESWVMSTHIPMTSQRF